MTEFYTEREKEILELDVRRKIYDLVKKNAGCHFREIERKCNLSTGVVKYHLSYLVKNALIQESRVQNNLRYFPKGNIENKNILSLLRQKTVREILLTLILKSSSTHDNICQNVRVSPSTISWHLRKLEHQNVVACQKEGRNTFYSLTIPKEEIVKLLIIYRESFIDALVERVIEMFDTTNLYE